jgi:hypothetical protein
MSAFLDVFYDMVRQGLPTIGAISGLTWATADGVARQRAEMVSRGVLGASIGWGLGYIAKALVLNMIDGIEGTELPNTMASLGPGGGQMGWTEPGTMPNPTMHPEPFANPGGLPKSQGLEGETNQTLHTT